MFLELFFATSILSIPLLLAADWRDDVRRPVSAGNVIALPATAAQPLLADVPAGLAREPATALLDVPDVSLKSAA
jgi:hypothetical protein